MYGWIVIADAAIARIFSLNEKGASLELVKVLTHPASRARDRELLTDRPGRLQKGRGRLIHSAMESPTDAHMVHVERFVNEIGVALQDAVDRRAFDSLAIVAPPKMLGLLRKHPGVQAVKGEQENVAMECTHVPIEDLPIHLNAVLPGWFPPLKPMASRRSVPLSR